MALIVLDSSVLIGLLDSSDAHHDAAQAALRHHLAERDELLIPLTAYAELLVGPMASGSRAVGEVEATLEALPVGVESATREVAVEAARLRARHRAKLRLPDAFVCATAIIKGADLILTADSGWPRISVPVKVLGRARKPTR